MTPTTLIKITVMTAKREKMRMSQTMLAYQYDRAVTPTIICNSFILLVRSLTRNREKLATTVVAANVTNMENIITGRVMEDS